MIQWIQSLKMLLTLTLLTGVVYPFVITVIAQTVFPEQAKGSLIIHENKVIGSLLIGQNFKKGEYIHPRPSFVDFNPLKPAAGSNLGPTSNSLKLAVEERIKQYESLPPADLVYASASGLDPHISIQAALFQTDRIAKSRGIDELSALKTFITSQVSEGAPYINVLLLNIALDNHFPAKKSS